MKKCKEAFWMKGYLPVARALCNMLCAQLLCGGPNVRGIQNHKVGVFCPTNT